MKYQVIVYLNTPQGRWACSSESPEAVFATEAPWLWLARMLARSNLGNTGRLGYGIKRAGAVVEQFPTEESPASEPVTGA